MLNTICHDGGTLVDGPFGQDGRVPLLLVHGLFGSAKNWGGFARRLSAGRPVLTVDMRNHGDSPRMDSHTYADMARDIAEVIAAHGGRAHVMGHSMGGKTVMQLALTRPEMLASVVVADIAPVPYAHSQIGNIHAMRDTDLNGLTGRADAEARLAERVEDPALRAFFLQSLDLRADPPRWKLNLDVLERAMPGIIGWPGTEGRYDGPTLFLTGADSHYVLPEHRPVIQALFPRARFARIPGAGHWLHADRPREFEASISAWLEAVGG